MKDLEEDEEPPEEEEEAVEEIPPKNNYIEYSCEKDKKEPPNVTFELIKVCQLEDYTTKIKSNIGGVKR